MGEQSSCPRPPAPNTRQSSRNEKYIMSNRSPFCIVAFAAISLPLLAASANAQTYREAVLADNPIHYWSFDEAGGNAIDQVAPLFENELISQGGAGRVASTTNAGGLSLGFAADFNGNNGNRFYAADISGSQTSNSWAVEFWVRVLDPGRDSYISESSLGGVLNRTSVIHGYNDGVLELFAGGAGRTSSTGPTHLADGQWHHVVAGNDTDSLTHTFIIDNGAPITGGLVTDFMGLEQLALGNTAFGGGVNGMVGQLDEYAIYDFPGVDGPAFVAALENLAEHHSIPEPGAVSLLVIGGTLAAARRTRRS